MGGHADARKPGASSGKGSARGDTGVDCTIEVVV
jgi:hypothetical protein